MSLPIKSSSLAAVHGLLYDCICMLMYVKAQLCAARMLKDKYAVSLVLISVLAHLHR